MTEPDLLRARREAEELARIARFLTETLDAATVGRRVVESVRALFEVPAAGLRLREADGSLVQVATAGTEVPTCRPATAPRPAPGSIPTCSIPVGRFASRISSTRRP